MPSYHPAKAPKLAKGSGGMSIMGMIARKQAMDKAEESGRVRGAKAGQGLDIASEQLSTVEEQMKRMGMSLDADLSSNEGGM